jgi:thymidylate kinase
MVLPDAHAIGKNLTPKSKEKEGKRGYAARADAEPQRFAVLDAARPLPEVWQQIRATVEARPW